MNEIERFKEHGNRASFHYADDTGHEWSLGDVEKRIAIEIFDTNKELQREMREIARSFLWSLP